MSIHHWSGWPRSRAAPPARPAPQPPGPHRAQPPVGLQCSQGQELSRRWAPGGGEHVPSGLHLWLLQPLGSWGGSGTAEASSGLEEPLVQGVVEAAVPQVGQEDGNGGSCPHPFGGMSTTVTPPTSHHPTTASCWLRRGVDPQMLQAALQGNPSATTFLLPCGSTCAGERPAFSLRKG